MAIIQTVAPVQGTFGELATHLLKRIVNIAVYSKCKRVDFVCDRYPNESIKNLQRDRRAANGIQLIRIYSDNREVPRLWKKFLSSNENKEELLKFLLNPWRKADAGLLKGVDVFLTYEENWY